VGTNCAATGNYATVSGGYDNRASGGWYGTVGGGTGNTPNGNAATVGGGFSNTASGEAATVSGGVYNTAGGQYSFAAGMWANAAHTASFVWNDRFNTPGASTASNQVIFYYGGGGASCFLDGNAFGWQCPIDPSFNENFAQTNGREILGKMTAMPVQEYNMKRADPSIRRVGAVPQDFRAAFQLGTDDMTTNTMDVIGVTMASVQGLYEIIQEKDEEIMKQQDEIRSLKETLNSLIARMDALEGEKK